MNQTAGGAKKKPVLVWIHGGGFTEGGHREGLYGPDFLLQEDVVVVAVQYRLGIFGFLNLGEGNYTGNMGLKDQRLALKWIYNNIENFDGNKSEILLFGESAGEFYFQFPKFVHKVYTTNCRWRINYISFAERRVTKVFFTSDGHERIGVQLLCVHHTRSQKEIR